jgi:DNA-binding PadR family transcriptional regulator
MHARQTGSTLIWTAADDWTDMKLEHLLLGILLVKPRTGYDLSRYMEMEGVFMRPRTQMSQVYRSLAQMTDRGWVTFTVRTRAAPNDAKIFETTALGRETFMAWLTSPYRPTMEAVNYEFRARLFFSGFLGAESVVDLLTIEIDARRKQIAKYRYRDRTIEVGPDSLFDVGLVTMVEDFEHESGAASMDVTVARLVTLRELILDRITQEESADANVRSA